MPSSGQIINTFENFWKSKLVGSVIPRLYDSKWWEISEMTESHWCCDHRSAKYRLLAVAPHDKTIPYPCPNQVYWDFMRVAPFKYCPSMTCRLHTRLCTRTMNTAAQAQDSREKEDSRLSSFFILSHFLKETPDHVSLLSRLLFLSLMKKEPLA